MSTIADVAATMHQICTAYANQIASTNGFVRRRDKPLTGATFVQTVVCTLLAQPQASLAAYAHTAAALGVPLSEQAWHQNFTPAAADLLLAVLQRAAAVVLAAAAPCAADLLARFAAVFIFDSSCIALPPALADLWPGCGNGARPTPASSATLKLALGLELRTGSLFGVELLPGSVHDRATQLAAQAVIPQSVYVGDLGFFKLARFAEVAAAAGWWFSRLLTGTTIHRAEGQAGEVEPLLAAHPTTQFDEWVELGQKERLRARLVAVRVTQAVADGRRAKLHAAARRKGQTVSARRLASADWNVYITNIPVAQLSVEEAVILAGVRWQIELLFRRWKSQGRIDEWAGSANRWRILSEVYGKLLGMVLTQWIVAVSCWGMAERSLGQATAVVQRYAVLLVRRWDTDPALTDALAVIAKVIQATCRMPPRHKHPLTYQLLQDAALLAHREILA